MKTFCQAAAGALVVLWSLLPASGAEPKGEPAWRPLPLIAGDKIADGWAQVGWGGFVVDEGKREPKRPETGWLGLQNHDPGDVVWFREVSVRPLPKAVAQ